MSAARDSPVRLRWEAIDWSAPLAVGAVIPERHYMSLDGLGLEPSQRVALNRLMACFTCELFVHFEAYVIRYLERGAARLGDLAPAAVGRFVEEEVLHSEMFERLMAKLRGDLYPAPGGRRFLRWVRADDLALWLAPSTTFFLLAWLFEEITLFVPEAMAEAPEQSCPTVRAVMELHARDERAHVALDAHALARADARRPRALSWLMAALALPLLAYVDWRVRRAWRRLVGHAAGELQLSATQAARIAARGPTRSDVLGMRSFSEQLAQSGLAGAKLVAWVLDRELRRAGA